MKTVAIIGAGITGLVAGYRLMQRGLPVTIYEAGPRAGGVIETTSRDGFLAESGPNTIVEISPPIGELVRDLGLDADKIYSAPEAGNRYAVRNGRMVRMPATGSEFIASSLFSIAAKLRLAFEPIIARGAAARDESLEHFVLRRIGREFLDYAINPFVGGIYAGDPARLSVSHAFPRLHAVEQRYGSLLVGQYLGARERKRTGEVSRQNAPKFSFTGGLQTLTDALAARLRGKIFFRTAVERIAQADGGWCVTTLSGARSEHRHSAVLLTAPSYRLARIHLEMTDGGPGLEELAGIQYAPVTTLAIGFRREQIKHPLDGFGVLIPAIERRRILGALFNSSMFPGRAPENHALLTCYLGGTRAPEIAMLTLQEQVKLAMQDLEDLLGSRGAPVFIHRTVFRQAIPQYEVGFGRFKEVMSAIERQPGIFFAGHYRDGISVGDCILSAQRVADRLADNCAASIPTDEPRSIENQPPCVIA